jgi:hypothetical protein
MDRPRYLSGLRRDRRLRRLEFVRRSEAGRRDVPPGDGRSSGRVVFGRGAGGSNQHGEALCKLASDPDRFAAERGLSCPRAVEDIAFVANYEFAEATIVDVSVHGDRGTASVRVPYITQRETTTDELGLEKTSAGWKLTTLDPRP